MKKTAFVFLSLVTVVFMLAGESHAAKKKSSYSRPYGMAGCGLGSVVMGNRGGQIFAATTNNTFANQFFGITFNTLNCVDDANAQTALRMDQFVAGNKVALASDIARGEGETLNNLSAMMGCSADSQQFGSTMQAKFQQIFPSSDVHANQVTDSIITAVKQDEKLSAACSQII